ncbi:MAG: hypothetical protein JO051_08040 [Acidobacteriaceae bacterium]|nr:hypothetical protein [Acidobacteriaceae bacterium]
MNAKMDAVERLSKLDPPLYDVVVWMSLFDQVVDEIVDQPHNPHDNDHDQRIGRLLRVTAAMKLSVEELYNLYRGKGAKEESVAAASAPEARSSQEART